MDLGNYERFLGVRLSKDHNITTGKVYRTVITKERRGDYLGKTVQVRKERREPRAARREARSASAHSEAYARLHFHSHF